MSKAVHDRVDVLDTFRERHYTLSELAGMWAISYEAVRRLFAHEPGVFRINTKSDRRGRRDYAAVRVPESVARRVRERLLVP
jgi:hypothetical protein